MVEPEHDALLLVEVGVPSTFKIAHGRIFVQSLLNYNAKRDQQE
jgi:hypothetical protein